MDFATTNILEEALREINDAFVSQDPELLDTVFEIEEKKLYADKLRLSVISPTFKCMISKQWHKNKDKPIEIKGYKFKDFKELLTYIYSGKCNITETNILTMLDMAEFYQINQLKKFCDQYLVNMETDLSNVFQLIEVSNKYSMVEKQKELQIFVSKNFGGMVRCNEFFKADKAIIEGFLTFVPQIRIEKIFQAIYEWSEHQAFKKQQKSIDGNFNKNDTIKNEITPFLPQFLSRRMSPSFVKEYLGVRRFLFSDDEFNNILNNAALFVKVTNIYGKSIRGILLDDPDTIKTIKSLKSAKSQKYNHIWWNTKSKKCTLPSAPSPIQKREDVQWYLIYFSDGDIGVRHSSYDLKYEYLLANMDVVDEGFFFTSNCEIELE